jgi:hypothetical protein
MRWRRRSHWSKTLLLAAAAGGMLAGCVVVPVGGFPRTGPAIVLPAPGVVVVPGPVVGHGHWRRWHG